MHDRHGEQFNKRIKTADLEQLKSGLTLQTEAVLSGMKGNALCTFTGIRILKMRKGMKGILMHTGDSSLYECAPGNKRITKLTKSNFWMVGKTDRFYQFDLVDIKPDVLLLLATDGIPDLTNTSGDNYNNDTSRIIFSHPVEEIPQRLIDEVTKQCGLNDDAAILSVLPRQLHASDRRILLEGG
jgi:serine/threonine protein phosphatase PrpC